MPTRPKSSLCSAARSRNFSRALIPRAPPPPPFAPALFCFFTRRPINFACASFYPFSHGVVDIPPGFLRVERASPSADRHLSAFSRTCRRRRVKTAGASVQSRSFSSTKHLVGSGFAANLIGFPNSLLSTSLPLRLRKSGNMVTFFVRFFFYSCFVSYGRPSMFPNVLRFELMGGHPFLEPGVCEKWYCIREAVQHRSTRGRAEERIMWVQLFPHR